VSLCVFRAQFTLEAGLPAALAGATNENIWLEVALSMVLLILKFMFARIKIAPAGICTKNSSHCCNSIGGHISLIKIAANYLEHY
jgi:hypothetical protein